MNQNLQKKPIVYEGKCFDCPISMAMALIGGKWKGVILHYLKDNQKRFNELKKDIPAITEMTLSLQLKQLEQDGLITRQVFGEKPPIKVVYALTPKGRDVSPVLDALCLWAKKISEENISKESMTQSV
ncbi:helix-turn-helix domain-containing protein [Orbaceae bacterium ESL0727]|nr:helix-turn-helix domain-containing protein [Orbaceae bacterium ESL0727]